MASGRWSGSGGSSAATVAPRQQGQATPRISWSRGGVDSGLCRNEDAGPPLGSLWYTFSAMRFWGRRSVGGVGELRWTALPFTNSSRKSAAARLRSPKLRKRSQRSRLNWPSKITEPNSTPAPLSRFGRPLQNVAAQDGCRLAEHSRLPGRPFIVAPTIGCLRRMGRRQGWLPLSQECRR
jgi:hypothetical protein